ncbi:MAG: glycoside hydrolase family 26 protein [Muribaculaceae bacterium]|nr:glycoside hydrolase family 26 protein [Muribaculaceae bacterium]
MKLLRYILPLGLLAVVAASCSDNMEDEVTFTPTTASSDAIAEGSTVDLLLHRDITVTYTHPVKIVNPAAITLNGKPVDGATANVCALNIPLRLEAGTDYTLTVGEGALVRYDHPEMAADPYVLHFTTRPAPVLDAELTDPAATPEAKKLFAFLQSQYGQKTMSGTMGAIAWDAGYYDAITAAAGKAPAVIGFDYIHLAASPANWIDYGDITPVKDAWEAGNIVQIMWHWNVPRLNNPKAQLSTGISRFSPSNAMVPGNWEYDIMEADIAKVAGYLKLIQDAGIPVIFRPFHEAAGDYAPSWGPWFWWGAEGVDVTKQLWDHLYDKLVNDYGIHNMIWCWTVQTCNAGELASLDQLQGAYVGNDKCDFVGVDIYSDDDLFSDFDRFYLTRELVEGKKMVALSECGNLFNPDVAFEKGETWLYFMQWYETENNTYFIKSYSPAETWQQVVNSPYTLNREDVKPLLK